VIYNLVEYIRDELYDEDVYVNGRAQLAHAVIPDRCILVKESGGSIRPWTRYASLTVQVLTRDKDAPKARALAHDVLNTLHDKFGLILPAALVDGVTYAQVQVAQISALQLPYPLGPDEDGRSVFTTNYQVIMEY
jgi:hypothetical protein